MSVSSLLVNINERDESQVLSGLDARFLKPFSSSMIAFIRNGQNVAASTLDAKLINESIHEQLSLLFSIIRDLSLSSLML